MGFELPFVIGPEYIAVALFGVTVIGIIFGAILGMTATMAVAVPPPDLRLPMEMALYLLLGLYVGGISGGLVPPSSSTFPAPRRRCVRPSTDTQWPCGARENAP